jgi:hypothetical protein
MKKKICTAPLGSSIKGVHKIFANFNPPPSCPLLADPLLPCCGRLHQVKTCYREQIADLIYHYIVVRRLWLDISPRRRRHFIAAASHSLKLQPAVFEARRRQSYLRHGGLAIFFRQTAIFTYGSDGTPFLHIRLLLYDL